FGPRLRPNNSCLPSTELLSRKRVNSITKPPGQFSVERSANHKLLAAPIDCLRNNRLPYCRPPLLLKRVHQLIECLVELLDAFVLELLRGRVQINPQFT